MESVWRHPNRTDKTRLTGVNAKSGVCTTRSFLPIGRSKFMKLLYFFPSPTVMRLVSSSRRQTRPSSFFYPYSTFSLVVFPVQLLLNVLPARTREYGPPLMTAGPEFRSRFCLFFFSIYYDNGNDDGTRLGIVIYNAPYIYQGKIYGG